MTTSRRGAENKDDGLLGECIFIHERLLDRRINNAFSGEGQCKLMVTIFYLALALSLSFFCCAGNALETHFGSRGPLSGRPKSASSRQHFVPLSRPKPFSFCHRRTEKKMRHSLRHAHSETLHAQTPWRKVSQHMGHFLISQKKKERRIKRRRRANSIFIFQLFFRRKGARSSPSVFNVRQRRHGRVHDD